MAEKTNLEVKDQSSYCRLCAQQDWMLMLKKGHHKFNRRGYLQSERVYTLLTVGDSSFFERNLDTIDSKGAKGLVKVKQLLGFVA